MGMEDAAPQAHKLAAFFLFLGGVFMVTITFYEK